MQDVWSDVEHEDIAFLQLEGKMPASTRPLLLGSSKGSQGKSVRIFGYSRRDNGLWINAEILGSVLDSKGRNLIQLSSVPITPGFSGAPVWSDKDHRVIGMIHSHKQEQVFALPSETLIVVNPALTLSESKGTFAPNPFALVSRLSDNKPFFNRSHELKTVIDSINKFDCVSIVGEYGIGKSAFLHHLHNTKNSWLKNNDCRVAYIDCQRARSEDDLYQYMIEAIGGTGRGVRGLVDEVKRKPIIFLLDEFERITHFNNAGEVINTLRSILAEAKVAFVISTNRTLKEIEAGVGQLNVSIFSGLFTSVLMEPFSKESMSEYIRAQLQGTGAEFSISDLENIYSKSGGNLRQINLLASELYSKNTESQSDIELPDLEITDRFGTRLTLSKTDVVAGDEIEAILNLSTDGSIEEDYIFDVPANLIGSELNIILNLDGFELKGEHTASLALDHDISEQVARFQLIAVKSGRNKITAELFVNEDFATRLESEINVYPAEDFDLFPSQLQITPRPVPQPGFILQIEPEVDELKTNLK